MGMIGGILDDKEDDKIDCLAMFNVLLMSFVVFERKIIKFSRFIRVGRLILSYLF